jgi:hypothetical protein
MSAALRYFRVVIVIQIEVERNEPVIEKIARDPASSRHSHTTKAGSRSD